jgi:hypothetical protein
VGNRGTARRRALGLLTVACTFAIGCSGVQSRLEEEKALQVMRDIRSAEDTFHQRHGRYGEWKELTDAGLLSRSLAEGVAFGHRFELRAEEKNYHSVGAPVERDDRLAYVGWSFYLDESRVIRGKPYGKDNAYARADKSSPPIRSQ